MIRVSVTESTVALQRLETSGEGAERCPELGEDLVKNGKRRR